MIFNDYLLVGLLKAITYAMYNFLKVQKGNDESIPEILTNMSLLTPRPFLLN